MGRKDNTVRLTEEAHLLLAEKAKHLGDSMKEVASEAITSYVGRQTKEIEWYTQVCKEKAKLTRLRELVVVLGLTMWVLGCMLGFVIGAML